MPETSVHMIMYFVMAHLYRTVLNTSFWVPGMSELDQQLMERVFQSLKGLKPTRGKSCASDKAIADEPQTRSTSRRGSLKHTGLFKKYTKSRSSTPAFSNMHRNRRIYSWKVSRGW